MAKRKRARYAQIPNWVITHPGLDHTAFRLYCALSLHADSQDRRCFPSQRALMEESQIATKHTLIKALDRLEELGLIERLKRDGHSNIYTLPWDPPKASQVVSIADTTQGEKGSVNCCHYPVSIADTTPVSIADTRNILIKQTQKQKTQRDHPQGQAGDTCPECGAPALGEGCCPSCGWDYGQMELPTAAPQTCPECGLALQPDGTCWRHGAPHKPGIEKGCEGSPSLE